MERFWSKVEVLGPDDCWEWRGGVSPNGYGKFWFDKKQQCAHRVAYILTHGAGAIEDLVIDHLCRNTTCVNPEHLEAVPQQVNIERAVRKVLTHCKHGHEYTKENTTLTPSGVKLCRTCARAHARRYYYKNRKVGTSWVISTSRSPT